MDPRISIITLGVSDLKQSASFYKKLGFPVMTEMEEIIFFKLKNITFSIYPLDKLEEDIGKKTAEKPTASFTLAHNLESKQKVDELFNKLKELDVTIEKEPQDVFWGGYSGYFSDPDGYMWEVAWNPEWSEF